MTFFGANKSETAVTFLSKRVEIFDKAKEIIIQKINPQKRNSEIEEPNKSITITVTKAEVVDNKDKSDISFLDKRIESVDEAKEILTQKVNPQKYTEAKESFTQKVSPQKCDNVFEGSNGTLVLTETGVTIKRNGGWLSSHGAGEKNIPYKSITAVQFKKVGLTVGFIQLTIKGGVEAKGGAFGAVSDENTVTFGAKEKTQDFESAKSIIEQRIIEANSARPESNNTNDLDQLEKLASLKDKGIVSEEEFQAKKKQILGL